MRILQRNLKRTTDTFLFISHTMKLLLLKFRCNIFIGVRIIKEISKWDTPYSNVKEDVPMRLEGVWGLYSNSSTHSFYTGWLRSAALIPCEITLRAYWIGGWMGPRVNVDFLVEKTVLSVLGISILKCVWNIWKKETCIYVGQSNIITFFLHYFSLPSQSRWELRSFGLLRSE